MRYEPVGYIIEYEIGALLVFLVIMVRYIMARRFPNQKNQIFLIILWATLADVTFDVISSVIIDNVFLFPLHAVYIFNTAFYAISVFMLVMMMIYTIALTEFITLKTVRHWFPLLLPAIAVILLLLNNPANHLFFYVDPQRGYVHGKLFLTIYITSVAYVIFTLIIAIRYRAKMRTIEFWTIMCFLLVVSFATFLQYLIPTLLATGVAIIIAVVLMYFTIQNPDTMLDTTTNAFTYSAMLTFLNDCVQENKFVMIAAVKIYNMSRINELLGINNGTQVLFKVSDFMHMHSDDVWVFRMRSSCFVALTKNRKDYEKLCAKLQNRISQPWIVGEAEVMLQATICTIDTDKLLSAPITSKELTDFLESTFSQRDQNGSRVVMVDAGMELFHKVRRSQKVEAALREALETGEGFELHYQPLWSIKRQCFTSAEVLLRFHHPVMGTIPPDEFVPIAESKGLVTAMDELVVRKACAFLKQNDLTKGFGQEMLEINLSALEFMSHQLPVVLNDIMIEYGIDPSFICFEITETAATQSFDLLKECMTDICTFGCKFALDDFGTGYANIPQVIQLPFSYVKLDKSLLSGPPVVLNDMAHMFSSMNLATVAEGIETVEQVAMVESFNIDYIQGYHYAKPMSEQNYLAFLQKNPHS